MIYLLDPTLSAERVTAAIRDELPLAQYVAEYWHEHLQRYEASFSLRHSSIMLLFVATYRGDDQRITHILSQ